MAQESKPVKPAAEGSADAPTKTPPPAATVDSDDDAEDVDDAAQAHDAQGGEGAGSSSAKKKKKRSKKKKGKEAATGGDAGLSAIEHALAGLSPDQLKGLLALNPALANELAASKEGGGGSSTDDRGDATAAALRKLNLEEVMTGLASSGKNVKDMASYKFWATQPVPKFGESAEKAKEEGPLQIQKVEDVAKTAQPLAAGFEWADMDLTNPEQMKEVYDLLNGHYVEDEGAMFRFKYSTSILKWYDPLPIPPYGTPQPDDPG